MSTIFTPGGLLRRFFGSAVSNAAGYSIGGAITPALEPLTQDIANEVWQAHTVKPLSATQAAQGAALGLVTPIDWETEASMTGIDGERFQALTEMQLEAPPTGQLLELLRRGAVDAEEMDAALARNGIAEQWRERVRRLRLVLPSVTDMVRFAVREVYDPASRSALDLDAEFPAAFAADADLIGLDRERAGQYWAAHWELPSYEQGAEMLFRGEITQAQFAQLLKALDYAPTWRGKLEAIARRIPPLSDMIRFAVREVYSPAVRNELGLDDDFPTEFVPEAALHGMDEDRARQYWAAHWRLPSAQQGYRMLWRGLITQAQLSTLLRALDYPPFWRDKLASMAHLVPGRVDLRRMYKADVLTRAEVLAGYIRLGYTPADAETLTAFADAEKQGGSVGKEATRAELAIEFEGGFITEAEYRAALSTLGYSPADQTIQVELGGARAVKTERGRVVTAIHKAFVGHKITEPQARAALTGTTMIGEAVDRIMPLWILERDLTQPELTQAQVRAAFRKGLLTLDAAVAELVSRGLSEDDARAYLQS